jgi:ribosome-associated translation inhibitor RaiA
MLTPESVQITFRGLESSDALKEDILARVAKLESQHPHLTKCSIVIDLPHHHHRHGRLYHVGLVLHESGREIAVSREHHDAHAHEDVYVAIRDAFVAAEKRLESLKRS